MKFKKQREEFIETLVDDDFDYIALKLKTDNNNLKELTKKLPSKKFISDTFIP